MIDSTTIDYGISKVSEMVTNITTSQMAEEYVNFILMKTVVSFSIVTMAMILLIPLNIYFVKNAIKSEEEYGYVDDFWLGASIINSIVTTVVLIVWMVELYAMIIALINPQMFAITNMF